MSDDESDSGGGSKRTYKIVLLGDQGVGKTSIISRFTSNKFRPKENPTEGVDFFGKNVVHESKNHRLQLWDTSGNERYRKLIPNYLKDAQCGLFVYDRTDLSTLENLENWMKIFKESTKEKATIAFCQNKNDLAYQGSKNQPINSIENSNDPTESKDERKQQASGNENSILFQQKVKQLSEKYQMKHFSVSAAAGKQIHPMFHDLIDEMKQKSQNNSSGAQKLKQLIEKERMKCKIEEKIAQEKANSSHNFASTSNSMITEQHADKISGRTSNFEFNEPLDFNIKSPRMNKDKGRRKRKIHKITNIPSMEFNEDESQVDEPEENHPAPSIWRRVCPCLFK